MATWLSTAQAASQWASTTSGAGNWLVMQDDGNLVVYNSASSPWWSSRTAPRSGARLVMQDDGNLVIYQGSTPVWDRYGGAGNAKVDAFRAWALDSNNWDSWTPAGNRGVDVDGASGAQCADLGIAWSIQAGHRVGFDGWDTASASKPGWHFVSGSLAQAQPGGVITRVGAHNTSLSSSARLSVAWSEWYSKTPGPLRPQATRRPRPA